MMTNGNWNKSKIENKNEHIQNMKDELFMMKYGYWLKIVDELENLDKEYGKFFKPPPNLTPIEPKLTNLPHLLLFISNPMFCISIKYG